MTGLTFRQLEAREEVEELSAALKTILISLGSGLLHSGNIVANLHVFERIQTLIMGDEESIDLSPLFVDMAMLSTSPISEAKDMKEYLWIKEVIYTYLVKYSQLRSADLSLLCFNAFEKDLGSKDPQLKSLALKYYSKLKYVQYFSLIVGFTYICAESIDTLMRFQERIMPV